MINLYRRGRRPAPPDLIRMGVVKRKLTRKEARQITEEVMATGIKNPETRFALAVIKAIDVTEAA